MTEREHCEAVAYTAWHEAWDCTCDPDIPWCEGKCAERHLASIVERERAAAWLEGRNAGLDAAKRAFDDILAKDVAAARDQALEEARARLCGIEHDADYPEDVSPCACAAIRALKAGCR